MTSPGVTSPPVSGPVTVALDDHTYEIDLTNKNARALRKALSPYIGVGRRVKTLRGAKVKHIRVGADARTIKEWFEQIDTRSPIAAGCRTTSEQPSKSPTSGSGIPRALKSAVRLRQ